jgi:hypothetical protein
MVVKKDGVFRMRDEKIIQALAGLELWKNQDKCSGLSHCWSRFDWMSLEQMVYLPVTTVWLDSTASLKQIAYYYSSVPEARSARQAILSVLRLSYLCRRDGVVFVAIRLRVGQLTSRASFLGRYKSFLLFHPQLPYQLWGPIQPTTQC